MQTLGQEEDTALEKHVFDVIIVGAGFSGIGMARHLRAKFNDNFLVLEKGNHIGGVWRDNTYPAAACDAPSHLYSFSFYTNYPWSRRFAPQAEILAYLNSCVVRFHLEPFIRLNQEVYSAKWDNESALWFVQSKDENYKCRSIIWATGQLNRPNIPKLNGIESFKGVAFHSAEWRHDIDLSGKRVAVIGTGSSAIQFCPEIVKVVKELVIYQRSPGYVRPKPEVTYTEKQLALFNRFPLIRKIDRLKFYFQNEYRYTFFENRRKNLKAQNGFKVTLENIISDATLRQKLTPSYLLGCKRGLPSNEWIPMFKLPNVSLRTEEIIEVDPEGIMTSSGAIQKTDVIIYATGFRATHFLEPIKIIGLNEAFLHSQWSAGACAYLGMTVSGFPNMFILYGPNTNLGHTSVLFMLETQFDYIMKALKHVFRRNILEVRKDVDRVYNEKLQRNLENSVMVQGGCTSWYKNNDGRVTNNWPGFSFAYRLQARFRKSDYKIISRASSWEPDC